MDPGYKRQQEAAFDEFVKQVEADGLPFFRFEVKLFPGVIVVDSDKPENVTLNAHLPGFKKPSIGHVFATGKGESFKIDDLYVDPDFRTITIGSKLMEQALAAIEKFKPSVIKGSFKVREHNYSTAKHLFQKFGFTVSQEPDNMISIFKDGPARKG